MKASFEGEIEAGLYAFEVDTYHVCPVGKCSGAPPSGAASGDDETHLGWTLVGLGIGFAAFYLIGGVAYNVKKNEMPANAGALPHKEWWGSLPGLSKDGVAFSVTKTKEWASRAKGWIDAKRGKGEEYATL